MASLILQIIAFLLLLFAAAGTNIAAPYNPMALGLALWLLSGIISRPMPPPES